MSTLKLHRHFVALGRITCGFCYISWIFIVLLVVCVSRGKRLALLACDKFINMLSLCSNLTKISLLHVTLCNNLTTRVISLCNDNAGHLWQFNICPHIYLGPNIVPLFLSAIES